MPSLVYSPLLLCRSVVVVEDGQQMAILKASSPAAPLIILSSELILGRRPRQAGIPFVASPIVSFAFVDRVCDALSAIFPAKASAISVLRNLRASKEPLHRHLLVFLAVALHGGTYEMLGGGIEGYVRHELSRLPLALSRSFLMAVSFAGAFASTDHRFLSLASSDKDELQDILKKGSLLIQHKETAAAWHPWVAKEMLLACEQTLFGPDLLTKGLVGALAAIDSTKERLDLLKHLLFRRSGKDFSVLMQWCTNYLAPGQDSDDNRERHIVFPFTDLRHFVARKEGQQFEAHCHLLWSRVLREACRLDEALVEAKLAVKIEPVPSFSAKQNCGLVQLHLGERQLRDGKDSSLLRSALDDYAVLSNIAVEAGSKKKLAETALRFLQKLPRNDAKSHVAVFGLNKDMLRKAPVIWRS